MFPQDFIINYDEFYGSSYTLIVDVVYSEYLQPIIQRFTVFT